MVIRAFSVAGFTFVIVMGNGHFLVLRSSAGSGKTFALVRHFLRLALGSKSPAAYRHILAITFTNAAAAEMKERILKHLHAFSAGPSHPDFNHSLFNDLCTELNLLPDELTQRAVAVYRHMLHHYSLLGVSTIDSFTHRLIRSFAFELQLGSDFGIELDTKRFIQEVVDECIAQSGERQQLARYLSQYVVQRLLEEETWNPRRSLLRTAQLLLNEDSIPHLERLGHLELMDFERIQKSLRDECRSYLAILQVEADALRNMVLKFPEEWFSYRDLPNYLRKLSNGAVEPPGQRLLGQLYSKAFYRKNETAEVRKQMDDAFGEMAVHLNRIVECTAGEKYNRYRLCKMIADELYATGLLNEMNEAGKNWRKNENCILISDFHKLVWNVVRDNPAPFLFERLGERYRHFMIDEFQDTSRMQWLNLMPLLENGLASGHFSLVVGDSKQAIYRWRSGYVQQFIDLPRIKGTARALFEGAFAEQKLDTNYRSDHHVVAFNNALYRALTADVAHLQQAYGDLIQKVKRNTPGYVKFKWVAGESDDDSTEGLLGEVLQSIQQCNKLGYSYRDMAVLLRSNREIGKAASYLAANGIPVETSESFLLVKSPQVRALIGVLRYLAGPHHRSAALQMAFHLCSLSQAFDFTEVLERYTPRGSKRLTLDAAAFLRTHFVELFATMQRPLPLYELCVTLAAALQLKADSFIESFFETVLTNPHFTPREFVHWFEERADDLYARPAGTDAVKLMTIHKSKGLQFPVVIYPRFFQHNKRSYLWVESGTIHPELPVAYIPYQNPDDLPLTDFEQERAMRELDDMNLMYVATTRAEEKLYLFFQASRATDSKSARVQWQNRFSNALSGAFEAYDSRSGVLELGDADTRKLAVAQTPAFANRIDAPSLFSALPEEETNEESEVLQEAALNRGRILHALLASYSAGSFSLHESARENEAWHEMMPLANAIVEHPQMKQWFAGEKAMTEAELITPRGRLLRPDRVVFFDDAIHVVDFKTGSEYPGHHKQVNEYVQCLAQMYNIPVSGYLAYAETLKVVQVA